MFGLGLRWELDLEVGAKAGQGLGTANAAVARERGGGPALGTANAALARERGGGSALGTANAAMARERGEGPAQAPRTRRAFANAVPHWRWGRERGASTANAVKAWQVYI